MPSWAPWTRPAISTTWRKAGTLLKNQHNHLHIKECKQMNRHLQKQLYQTTLLAKLQTTYLAGLWNSQRKFHLSSGTATRCIWGESKVIGIRKLFCIFNKFIFKRCKMHCLYSSHGLKMMYWHVTGFTVGIVSNVGIVMSILQVMLLLQGMSIL